MAPVALLLVVAACAAALAVCRRQVLTFRDRKNIVFSTVWPSGLALADSYQPVFLGILHGSLFWVGLVLVFRISPVSLWIAPFTTLLSLSFTGLCLYFSTVASIKDPGYLTRLPLEQRRKELVEMVELGEFDGWHWNIQDMVRLPLRAKFCSTCKKVVVRMDQ